jgi:autotransporter-associated beta strand protein
MPRHLYRPRILAASIALLSAGTLHAVSDTWTGATDGDFLNPANWLGNNVPGAPGLLNGNTDTATFNNAVNTAITLSADRNLKFLNFFNTGGGLGAFTLSGSTLSLSDSLTTAGAVQLFGGWSAANQTINNNLLLNRNTGSVDYLFAVSPGYGGTLTFGGAITTAATTATTQLAVRSGTASQIVLSGGIHDNAAGLVQVNVAVSSTGTTTLSGVNGFTGGLLAQGGRVLIDDTAGGAVLAAGNALTASSATVEFRGASSGASSETLGNYLAGQFSSNRVLLNPNGGSGLTVQVAGLGISGTGAVGLSLFDLPAGTVFKTAAALPVNSTSANVSLRNGIVMSSGNPGTGNSFRASYFIKDSGGTGFATQNANNELVRFTGATVLAPGVDEATVTSANSHYLLSSSLTRTAALNFSTFQIDTSGGAVTLNMGANAFNATAAHGRTLLVTGSNDATVTGTGSVSNTVFVRNQGTGVFTLDQTLVAGQALISSGPGFNVYSRALAGDLYVAEGALRMTLDQNYNVNILRIYDGGVLELGADLNGTGTGDFSRALSNAPAANQLAFLGSGGFSAFTATPGGTRVVNFGGAGAGVQWNANGFVSGELVLSSERSNATLELANPIDLTNASRTIQVHNGSAPIDARLLGALTGTSGFNSGIYKTGTGTLELGPAISSYTGTTEVAAGRLLLSGALSGTVAAIVSGGTLELGASNVLNNAAAIKLESGVFATGGFSDTVGALTLAGSAILDMGTGASLFTFANSSAQPWTGTLSITNWSGSQSGGGTDQLFFGSDATGLSSVQIAAVQFVNPDGFAPGNYGAKLLDTGELVAIPEPGAAASLLGGLGLLLGLRRRRS